MASIVVGTLRALLTADTAQFEAGIRKATSGLQAFSRDWGRVGQQMSTIGRSMTAAVTLPIVGAGVAATKLAMDFESSFAGVRKTVNATEVEFKQMSKAFRDLAKTIPVNVNELNRLGEAAGALGIPKKEIVDFARVMALLGQTTNVTADQAAESIAKIQNIFGAAGQDTDRFASTLVALGNDGASTEAQILEMATRIAGAGNVIGLRQGQVLGFASALSSVGLEAEAGGTAISRVFIDIASSVSKGGDQLTNFSHVAGLSTAEFSKMFKTDAAGAVTAFIEGLGRIKTSGGDVIGTLSTLGIEEVRLRDTLLRASGAGDLLRTSLELQGKAWRDNSALTEEARKRFETTESQLTLLWNRLKDVGITLGNALLPLIQAAVEAMNTFVPVLERAAQLFGELPVPVQAVVVGFGLLLAAVGPVLFVMGQMITAATTVAALFSGPAAVGMGTLALAARGLTLALGPVAIAIGAIWTAWQIGNIEGVKNTIAEWTLRLQGYTKEAAHAAVAGHAAAVAAVAHGTATKDALAPMASHATAIKASTAGALGLIEPVKKLTAAQRADFAAVMHNVEAQMQLAKQYAATQLAWRKLATEMSDQTMKDLTSRIEAIQKAQLEAIVDTMKVRQSSAKIQKDIDFDVAQSAIDAAKKHGAAWQTVYRMETDLSKARLAAAVDDANRQFQAETALIDRTTQIGRDQYAAYAEEHRLRVDQMVGDWRTGEEAKIEALRHTHDIWVRTWDSLRELQAGIVQSVTDGFASIIMGATSFKDAMLNIWRSIQQGIAKILSDILSDYIGRFIKGLLGASSWLGGSGGITGQLGGSVAGMIGLGGAGTGAAAGVAGVEAGVLGGVGGGAAAGGGAAGTAGAVGTGIGVGSTIALTGGIAAGALLAWGIWKKGLFRGGEESLKVNPARDVFLQQFGGAGTGPDSGFRHLADQLFGLDKNEALFKALTDASSMKEFDAAVAAIATRLDEAAAAAKDLGDQAGDAAGTARWGFNEARDAISKLHDAAADPKAIHDLTNQLDAAARAGVTDFGFMTVAIARAMKEAGAHVSDMRDLIAKPIDIQVRWAVENLPNLPSPSGGGAASQGDIEKFLRENTNPDGSTDIHRLKQAFGNIPGRHFGGMITAHEGMYVGGVGTGERMIKALVGEGVLSKWATSMLGGKAGIDAMNAGRWGEVSWPSSSPSLGASVATTKAVAAGGGGSLTVNIQPGAIAITSSGNPEQDARRLMPALVTEIRRNFSGTRSDLQTALGIA